jgi:hypothetical protein
MPPELVDLIADCTRFCALVQESLASELATLKVQCGDSNEHVYAARVLEEPTLRSSFSWVTQEALHHIFNRHVGLNTLGASTASVATPIGPTLLLLRAH